MDPDLDIGPKKFKGKIFYLLEELGAFSVGLEAFAGACTSFVLVQEERFFDFLDFYCCQFFVIKTGSGS